MSGGPRSSQTELTQANSLEMRGSCSKYEGNYLKVTHIFRGSGAAARADHVKICKRLLARLFRATGTLHSACIVSVTVVYTCAQVEPLRGLPLFQWENFFVCNFTYGIRDSLALSCVRAGEIATGTNIQKFHSFR